MVWLALLSGESHWRAKGWRVLKGNDKRYAGAVQVFAFDRKAVFLPVVELDTLIDVVDAIEAVIVQAKDDLIVPLSLETTNGRALPSSCSARSTPRYRR